MLEQDYNMKKLLFILSFFFLFTGLFAYDFSKAETELIYKTLDARLNTRTCASSDEAIKVLDNYSASIFSDSLYKDAGTEARFVVDNMLVLEKYSYMYEKNMTSPDLKPFILAQYEKINEYTAAHENEKLSPWFYLSSGDVINSSMQFISQATAIKLGLKEKDDYDDVVKNNPDLAFARINRALWYYFAPAIGGGSKSVAKNDFNKAVETAACDYERFYSRIFLSQIYYDDGNTSECKKLLDECDKILPGNVYTPFIRFLNDNKYSLLFYTNNREKVEKKLGL